MLFIQKRQTFVASIQVTNNLLLKISKLCVSQVWIWKSTREVVNNPKERSLIKEHSDKGGPKMSDRFLPPAAIKKQKKK